MATPSEVPRDNDQVAGQKPNGELRDGSLSVASEGAQTASEYENRPNSWLLGSSTAQVLISTFRFINSQLQLEADAREALPYVSKQLENALTLLNSFRLSIIAPILSVLSNKTFSPA